jgi:large subunit ribosomal protein L23
MRNTEVLMRPILTEKTDAMGERLNQYVFEVSQRANKQQIRDAVQELFHVNVVSVRTMVMPGKQRRWGRHVSHTSAWKKAVVTVGAGEQINLFE